MRSPLLALLALLAVSAAPAFAEEPAPEPTLTLELKAAKAEKVFKMLSDVAATPIVVPPCAAEQHVDVLLKNAPVAVVLDVIARKAGATVSRQAGAYVLVCAADAAAVRALLDRRIDLDLREAALGDVVALLAQQGGLTVEGTLPDMRVTISLHNVRLETALAAVAEGAGLPGLVVDGARVTVVAAKPAP